MSILFDQWARTRCKIEETDLYYITVIPNMTNNNEQIDLATMINQLNTKHVENTKLAIMLEQMKASTSTLARELQRLKKVVGEDKPIRKIKDEEPPFKRQRRT